GRVNAAGDIDRRHFSQRGQECADGQVAQVVLAQEKSGEEKQLAFREQREVDVESGEAEKNGRDAEGGSERDGAFVSGDRAFGEVIRLDRRRWPEAGAQQGGGEIDRGGAGEKDP